MAPGAAAILLASSLACNSAPQFDYTGTWVGHQEVKGVPGADPDVLRSIGRIELHVLRNGRFALLESGMSREGIVEPTSKGIRLRVDSIAGRPLRGQPDEVQKAAPTYEVESPMQETVTFLNLERPNERITLKRDPKP